MNQMSSRRNYFARPTRRYTYPNEAEPGYFLGKIRNGLLAALSSMCTVTFFLYLATI